MPLLLPFFKFDVQAWLTSETVTLMKNEQRGAFITLLSKCWANVHCTLPNSLERVKALADWEGTDLAFAQVWRGFIPHKTMPDRVINVRLLKEWKDAKRKQLFYAERAKLGSDARWKQKKTPRKPSAAKPPVDWLAAIKTNPLYAHVNFEREEAKMADWLADHPGRIKNKQFVRSWLNKIEPPLPNGAGTSLTCPHHPTLTFPDLQAKKTHDFSYHPKYVG